MAALTVGKKAPLFTLPSDGGQDISVLGVSRDSVKKHCNFRDKYELNFPLLSDEKETVCNLYGVMKEKSMYGKKYMGIERSTFIIDEKGVLVKEYRNVKAASHVNDLLRDLP